MYNKYKNLAWVITLLIQASIGSVLFFTLRVIHLKGYSLDIFWVVYPITIFAIGIFVPILLFYITNKWHYGIKSSIISGFFVLMIFIMITYLLIRKPDERGIALLPIVIGFIELIYITSNLIGTALAYILSRRKRNL